MTSRLVRAVLSAGMAFWLITAGLTPTEWLGAGQLIVLCAFFWSGVRGYWVAGAVHRAQTRYLTALVEQVRQERDAYVILLAESTRTTRDAVESLSGILDLIPREDPPC